MKRIVTIALSFMLMLGLCIPTYASAEKAKTIDELLAPYRAVIDKLNAELGSTMYIPDKNKERVYNNIKDMSLDEFETMLRNDYKTQSADKSSTTKSESSESGDYSRDSIKVKNDSDITIKSVREEITQTASISYNSEMYLTSTVFSATGASGTYTYSSISEYGSQWPSSYTGYHFAVDEGSYSLSSDRKKCTVTLKGHPENSSGIALTVALTAKNTFSAN